MNENDIIEIIDDIDDNSSEQLINDNKTLDIEKKVAEVKYDPLEPEKEKIEILEGDEPSKNKSGLLLVIILFILLGVFIIFLPEITNIIGNLF